MKKGRLIILDTYRGHSCAALIDDGVLQDLLVDPMQSERPLPGAIYRARTLRQIKGQNGIMVDLGQGQTGYLRNAKGIAPGTDMLVQVNTHAELHKAAPVVQKLIFKSRYCIVTPGAPGLNIARKIANDDERDRLLEIAHDTLDGAKDDLGLIVRSVAEDVDAEAIAEDITQMRDAAEDVLAQASGKPQLLRQAPTASEVAWCEWVDPDPDQVVQDDGGLEHLDFLPQIDALLRPHAKLGREAYMEIEPTSAFVAVDVNTGGDFSMAAGLKANLAAANDLPRQLRLRGLGGQIVVDFAPMPHKNRKQLEQTLKAALRKDGIETTLVGWTPLGHVELKRKRERLPLAEILTQ